MRLSDYLVDCRQHRVVFFCLGRSGEEECVSYARRYLQEQINYSEVLQKDVKNESSLFYCLETPSLETNRLLCLKYKGNIKKLDYLNNVLQDVSQRDTILLEVKSMPKVTTGVEVKCELSDRIGERMSLLGRMLKAARLDIEDTELLKSLAWNCKYFSDYHRCVQELSLLSDGQLNVQAAREMAEATDERRSFAHAFLSGNLADLIFYIRTLPAHNLLTMLHSACFRLYLFQMSEDESVLDLFKAGKGLRRVWRQGKHLYTVSHLLELMHLGCKCQQSVDIEFCSPVSVWRQELLLKFCSILGQ